MYPREFVYTIQEGMLSAVMIASLFNDAVVISSSMGCPLMVKEIRKGHGCQTPGSAFSVTRVSMAFMISGVGKVGLNLGAGESMYGRGVLRGFL